MNNFNIFATVVTASMLMLLWGAGKWNKYDDKKQRDKIRKKRADKFKQM